MPSKRDARSNTAGTAQGSQFAYLGLHQAASTGNVGLVQYALSQGQPVDAVWDGISALHAAAAGGSEHVARLLIENGADVNFGRQPRSERELKTRTASTSSASPPIDKAADGNFGKLQKGERELKPRSASLSSTSSPEALLHPGSTPMHFACAYNQVSIARLLLTYGATPHMPDKNGVTPLDLLPASNPGSVSTSSSDSGAALRTVIREYYEAEKAKEKEFRETQGQLRFHGKAAAVLGFPREDDGKRVGVKRSVENLLSKSPKHIPAPLAPSPGRRGTNGIGTPPPSPRRPSVPSSERVPPSPTSSSRYTFGSATPTSFASTPGPTTGSTFSSGTSALGTPPAPEQRRPSLPHLFDDAAPSPSPAVRPPATCARPRSAESGSQAPAFGSQPVSNAPAFSSSGHARPRTKRSLLSLFKKSDAAQDSSAERDISVERGQDRGSSFSSPRVANWPPTTATPTRSTSDFDEKAAMLNSQYYDEVRTAPPERTTFPVGNAHLPEEVFWKEDDDDEDNYGVPLVGTDPEPLPPEPGASTTSSDDEESDEEPDGEDTVEDHDGAHDPNLELERTGTAGTASTDHTVRPGRLQRPSGEGRFVPPKHSEGWYPDRTDAAQASGSSLGLPPQGPDNEDATHPPTSPRTRPGILRGDHSVRRTGSRGALRFEADRQEGQEGRALRERGSKSSLLSIGSRSLLSAGSGGGDGPRDKDIDRLIADNRMRGDSVSSASTDASAPARSQLSQETSTGTMTSTSSAPVPCLDSGRSRDGYADALLDSSEEEDGAPGLGLNIRTVSSHAQAEALVQKAAKEILELNAVADAGSGPSLSAQLAAYGETLQLERRFARGEAQRFKSPTRMRFEGGSATEEQEEERRREEDRKRKAQEMEWSQKVMDRYARDREGGRERKSPEILHKDRAVGCPLERTTSLEKEMGTRCTGKSTRPPKPPRMRRPHTSDSVQSAGSNSSAPRFGHGGAQSSNNILRVNGHGHAPRVFNTDRRAHHHASRSTSAQTRAESLDHDRPSPPILNEPVSAPLFLRDDPEDIDPAGSSRAFALEAANRSAFLASTAALDDMRPAKQRFGGLRSLFGRGR